jgi:hypothetical protein
MAGLFLVQYTQVALAVPLPPRLPLTTPAGNYKPLQVAVARADRLALRARAALLTPAKAAAVAGAQLLEGTEARAVTALTPEVVAAVVVRPAEQPTAEPVVRAETVKLKSGFMVRRYYE